MVIRKPYRMVVLGGTFDRLHEGHRSLLRTAAAIAQDGFVGIVTDELGTTLFKSKKLAIKINPYADRMAAVNAYLAHLKAPIKTGPLYDPWGPAITDAQADVIVVSPETLPSAHRINTIRQEHSLALLDIVIIPWQYNEEGVRLSSTLQREHEEARLL